MSNRMICVDEVEAQPWRNGGGLTRALLAGPNAQAWRWRIIVVDIENDVLFSSLPGAQR